MWFLAFMDQIALFFKCQPCSEYVLTTNIQCPNGHQVCQSCYENLSHCPTCHQRVAPSTRIPILLTANVSPILNVGDSFDLLLPSLLRVAPALHPCSADEMVYTDLPPNLSNNPMNSDTSMQKNNCLADQLLMVNSCEVEETLSRLMMLASISPVSNTSVSNITTNETAPPPEIISSSTPLSNIGKGVANAQSSQQEIDRFSDFWLSRKDNKQQDKIERILFANIYFQVYCLFHLVIKTVDSLGGKLKIIKSDKLIKCMDKKETAKDMQKIYNHSRPG